MDTKPTPDRMFQLQQCEKAMAELTLIIEDQESKAELSGVSRRVLRAFDLVNEVRKWILADKAARAQLAQMAIEKPSPAEKAVAAMAAQTEDKPEATDG